MESSFFLRIEPGAELVQEWRDDSRPYHTGPSLRVDGKGNLDAGGERLMTLPFEQWVEIRVRCGVGTNATGKYELSIHLPGKTEPVRFAALPSDPNFRSLDWFGFISNTTTASVFYVDDLHIALRK